ncbi:MAG: hypothetical protein JXB33_08190 [Clostridia bacterium]|nr:hypothetical protein [Clostridia bacterium]
MKRLFYILILVIFLTGICSLAFATTAREVTGAFRYDAPSRFTATGLIYDDPAPPFHKLQNMMEFTFIDGKEIHARFSTTYDANDSEYGPSEHIVDFYLVYDMNKFLTGEDDIIKGTFDYYHDYNGEIMEYTGTVTGYYITTMQRGFFPGDYDADNVILLDLVTSGEEWTWQIYLTPPEEFAYSTSTVDMERAIEDYYHSHESRPHIPSPSSQADVAVGVGITTVGIVILNSLTNTTLFGSAPFNSTFNPAAPPSSAPAAGSTPSGSGAATGTTGSAPGGTGSASAGTGPASGGSVQAGTPSASMGSVAAPPPAGGSVSAGSAAGSGSSGGFWGLIKDFFKNILVDLRDMLTDEGRSYASGKLTDVLKKGNVKDIDMG